MDSDRDRDDGFTLVELMTVVMIIAVLIAILIPNFLQARRPAEDRQAQTLLRNGLTTATATATAGPPDASALAAAEPSVRFVDAGTEARARDRRVSVATGTTGGHEYLLLASHSSSGRCYAVLSVPDTAPRYQRLDEDECRADGFDPATGWADAWP